MGKAKGDHTPDAAIQKMAAQPPLDDDRWLPIEAAHKRGVERTGDNDLAVIDLEKLLAEGCLPCMRRSTSSGERERVAAAAWLDQIRLYSGKEVSVIYREPLAQFKSHYIVNPVRGWRFYIWKPTLDRIWSPPAGSAPVDHDDASDEPPPTQEPTPQQRKPRKQGGGRRRKFEEGQRAWLRQRYHVAMKANPLLAKHEAAIPHVQKLAKTEFGIEAGPDTVLDQIIRPVLLVYFSIEK